MEESEKKKIKKNPKEIVAQLRLLDDDLMSIVFDRNIEATELLLHTILGRDDLEVVEVIGQKNYKNIMITGRAIRIDIYARDKEGKGLPVYHIRRTISETGEAFCDGSHIIYVNGSYRNPQQAIGRLMLDFCCRDSKDMFYSLLAEQVRYFKETEGGMKTMSKAVEEYGQMIAKEKVYAVTARMLKNGKLSLEEVAECTGLPLEMVKEIQKELTVTV